MTRFHHGTHYTVENARIYTLPDEPVPIYVSGFGPKAVQLAGRIGDGFICTMPDADLLRTFRETGGADKPTQAGMKVCYAPTEVQAVATAYRIWPNEHLPGELAQVLPTPRHFEQAAELVTPEMVADALPCGPDPDPYIEAVHSYVDAGFDEIYVQQIGPDQDAFFDFWQHKVQVGIGAARVSG